MSASLLGIGVLVTLRDPHRTVVQGLVASVLEQSSTLVLQNVLFPATGYRLPTYSIEGAQIADISVQPPPPPPSAVSTPPVYAAGHAPQFAPHVPPPPNPYAAPPGAAPAAAPIAHEVPVQEAAQSKQPFVDPAIMSIGRRPTVTAPSHSAPAVPQEAPSTPVKPMAAAAAAALPTNTSPFVGLAKKPSSAVKNGKEDPATLTAPFSALGIEAEGDLESDDPTADETTGRSSVLKMRAGKEMGTPTKPTESARKTKRTRNKKQPKKDQIFPPDETVNGPESSPEAARKTPANYKGKGWRQTPLLQDQPSNSPRTPGIIGGKVGLEAVNASNRKTRRQRAMEATNGWATEDATDVQELPDFDFAENLSKFDKRSVFEQIRNEDTTADEDRLVSFNRLPPRAGTAGGKNLHPTENVLEQRRPRLQSESSSDDDFSDFDSGRNSRRDMSRTSSKRAPFRSNSVLQDDGLPVPGPTAILSRSTRSQHSRPPGVASVGYSSTNSPNPGRPTPPSSPSASLLQQTHASFRIMSSNSTCHTITPGTMTAVEEVAEVEFGLTEEMTAENAARGIASIALSAVNPGGRRLARENLAVNSRPVVVVLAGNHRTGARAIAAARHLHARGPRVVVALLGYERPTDYDKDVRRQAEIFKRFGGYIRGWNDVQAGLKRLEAPPELIIDALLGRSKEFDALGREDRNTALAIVGWANQSRASVLSVEGPSGVGGSTGEVSILEGEPLEVRAKYIVCLGAPRSGLFRALQTGSVRDPDWLIWVVDLGLNRAWKRVVGPAAKGVRFGSEWAVQVRFDAGEVVGGGSGVGEGR